MRLLIAINRICYGSCLLAIVGGAFITVGAIWLEQEGVGWKGVSTAAVLIFAAILVLAVNSIIGLKVMNDGGDLRDFIPGRGLAAARPKPAGSFIAQRPSSENQSDLSDLPDLSDV